VKYKEEKIPVIVYVACGWPLFLVAVGGAIGGALGGAAYALNFFIYKSKLSVFLKYVLNIGIGLTAVVLWFIIALLFRKSIKP
jgi:hypothetical protein